jgi:hypothetical protein
MVSFLLFPEPNELDSYQKFRLLQERITQEQWDKNDQISPDKDAPFPLGLSACFHSISRWLGSSACGRKLRIRLKSDGRFLEATNDAEADRLIGPGKTLGTLTAAFSN